jgi:hypothetical protein
LVCMVRAGQARMRAVGVWVVMHRSHGSGAHGDLCLCVLRGARNTLRVSRAERFVESRRMNLLLLGMRVLLRMMLLLDLLGHLVLLLSLYLVVLLLLLDLLVLLLLLDLLVLLLLLNLLVLLLNLLVLLLLDLLVLLLLHHLLLVVRRQALSLACHADRGHLIGLHLWGAPGIPGGDKVLGLLGVLLLGMLLLLRMGRVLVVLDLLLRLLLLDLLQRVGRPHAQAELMCPARPEGLLLLLLLRGWVQIIAVLRRLRVLLLLERSLLLLLLLGMHIVVHGARGVAAVADEDASAATGSVCCGRTRRKASGFAGAVSGNVAFWILQSLPLFSLLFFSLFFSLSHTRWAAGCDVFVGTG